MPTHHHHPLPPPGPAEPLDLEHADDKLGVMRGLWRDYGDCYRVPSASRAADTWVINDPALIKQVLVSGHRNYVKGVGIERVRVLLGNGLMASEGSLWRSQRRMLQGGFHRARIAALLPVYTDEALRLRRRWQEAASAARPVDVTAAVSETTLSAVLRALFSEDLQRIGGETDNPFSLLSEEGRRDLEFAVRFRRLGKVVAQIIERRRREKYLPDDLLSHMLNARDKSTAEPMSERQLIDEVLTLIVAGHETTAAALGWVWRLLAAYPETLQQVCAEARAAQLDRVDRLPQLEALVWIPRVIKEALRLYPPGWLYTRRAVHDDRLGGYRVPAGTDIFICAYLLHRHPDHWERPEVFAPERFSASAEAQRNRYAYLPFSAGPRHCIGENFAMVEMIVHLGVLAAALRPRELPWKPPRLATGVNLRPRDALHLEFCHA